MVPRRGICPLPPMNVGNQQNVQKSIWNPPTQATWGAEAHLHAHAGYLWGLFIRTAIRIYRTCTQGPKGRNHPPVNETMCRWSTCGGALQIWGNKFHVCSREVQKRNLYHVWNRTPTKRWECRNRKRGGNETISVNINIIGHWFQEQTQGGRGTTQTWGGMWESAGMRQRMNVGQGSPGSWDGLPRGPGICTFHSLSEQPMACQPPPIYRSACAD